MIPPWVLADRPTLEEESRRRCQTAALGADRFVCRVLGRYLMYADPRDVDITPHLALNGFWEAWITLALARELRPGGHCIDVGANGGYYTLLMADGVGDEGRVLALEPAPAARRLLTWNVGLNGFAHRVRVSEAAATDGAAAEARLCITPDNPGRATLYATDQDAGERITVPAATIDSLVADWPRVDVVKIDTEGAEPSVWGGMRETLRRHRDIVVFLEFTPARYPAPFAFLADVAAMDFAVRQLDGSGLPAELTRDDVDALARSGQWTMLRLAREQARHALPD